MNAKLKERRKGDRRKQSYTVFDRPFVLFMGPQRSGSSWLERYLRSREDVCLPAGVKEVFFFDRDWDKGLLHYVSHFHPKKLQKYIAEISTTSFDHPKAPDRVHTMFNQDVQLVCPLRHPIDRSYSLYLHYLRYGIVSGTLQEACKQKPQIITSSYYAENLERWLEFFPLEKIAFTFQEDLEKDQDKYIRDISEIMDIPYVEAPESIRAKYNVATVSHSGPIATFAQQGADWLRTNQLYFIINFAKKIGLKRLIFGKEQPDNEGTIIPDDDYAFLKEKLGSEVEKLEKLFGHPIDVWK